nr:hypothetical protein BaRGS_020389 [Batillaria attramentaria]
MRKIFIRFAQSCSMQGPPYIYGSKLAYAKFLWVILTLTAFGFMAFHLFFLFTTYLAFPVKNEINLGFSNLDFPSVTVCNVNPVRMSKLGLLSEGFRELVDAIKPETLKELIDNLPYWTETNPDERRRKRQASAVPDFSDNFIDDLDLGINDLNFTNPIEDLGATDYEDWEDWEDSWEAEGEDSSFYQLEQELIDWYATQDRQSRIDAGHQLDDMLGRRKMLEGGGCRDETQEDLNIVMKVEDLRACRVQKGRDIKYEKTLSFRPWPHESFAMERGKGGVESPAPNIQNFVKLNIFYEDLNYENITEKPDYEDAQFISDVGGTLGLWIGLSVLSIFEVFQLVLELLRHFCCCRWRNGTSASSS